jgi:hypothetical protein
MLAGRLRADISKCDYEEERLLDSEAEMRMRVDGVDCMLSIGRTI